MPPFGLSARLQRFTSSPWVAHYVIGKMNIPGENVRITVASYLATSTGAAGTETYLVTTGQPAEPGAISDGADRWMVTDIQKQ